MDAARFDRLAKVLANRRSRRTALCAGGVGLALGALSRAGLPTRAQETTRTEGVPIEILYVQVATMWESSSPDYSWRRQYAAN